MPMACSGHAWSKLRATASITDLDTDPLEGAPSNCGSSTRRGPSNFPPPRPDEAHRRARPDLDIFRQAFVVREPTGWHITAAGRGYWLRSEASCAYGAATA
jgi:hypothetical protein